MKPFWRIISSKVGHALRVGLVNKSQAPACHLRPLSAHLMRFADGPKVTRFNIIIQQAHIVDSTLIQRHGVESTLNLY